MQGFIYNMDNNKCTMVCRYEVVNGLKEFWHLCWDSSNVAWWQLKLFTAVPKQNWTRNFKLNEVFWETFVPTNINRFEPEIRFVMLPCLNGTKS
jgi:hypothetical protein